MLLPINWLKQYVEINENADAIAERFIGLGFEAEKINEELLDLDVTPNRGDALSMIGLAREYAASTGKSVAMPTVTPLTYADTLPGFNLSAEPNAYHRIAAVIISGVTVSDSPDFIKSAVDSMAGNAINNIVDITNYVMFELGTPMHAFDLDALIGHDFKLRLSHESEKFTSLKDEERVLPSDLIVVESNQEIIDLVGIRGGKSSMITPSTKNILLWSTALPRPLIRKATKTLNIRTEGSYRHERETDWNMVPTALARAVDLIKKTAGGDASAAIDLQATTLEPKVIAFEPDRVNDLLGTSMPDSEIIQSLKRLGFTIEGENVTVPSWRYFDINHAEDLVEEVARIYGYNRLPRKVITVQENAATSQYAKIEALKDELTAHGFTEVYTESFSGREEGNYRGWDPAKLATLANPVNREFAYCRPELAVNLLKVLALNSWSDDAQLFEIGKAFPSVNAEVSYLAIAMYGKPNEYVRQMSAKAATVSIQPNDPIAQHLKLRKPATILEIPLCDINLPESNQIMVPQDNVTYQTVSIFPPSVRDIAILVDKSVNPDEVSQAIKKINPEHIIIAELFDSYTSDKLGTNKQSLAFHVVYQDIKKTLDTETVDKIHLLVIDRLQSDFNAVVR